MKDLLCKKAFCKNMERTDELLLVEITPKHFVPNCYLSFWPRGQAYLGATKELDGKLVQRILNAFSSKVPYISFLAFNFENPCSKFTHDITLKSLDIYPTEDKRKNA